MAMCSELFFRLRVIRCYEIELEIYHKCIMIFNIPTSSTLTALPKSDELKTVKHEGNEK